MLSFQPHAGLEKTCGSGASMNQSPALHTPTAFHEARTWGRLDLRLSPRKSLRGYLFEVSSLFLSIPHGPLPFTLGDRLFPSSECHLFPTLQSVGFGTDLPSLSIFSTSGLVQELRCFACANSATHLPQIHLDRSGSDGCWDLLTAFSRSTRYRRSPQHADMDVEVNIRAALRQSGSVLFPSDITGVSACPLATTAPHSLCAACASMIYLRGVSLFLVIRCVHFTLLNVSWLQNVSEKGSLLPLSEHCPSRMRQDRPPSDGV